MTKDELEGRIRAIEAVLIELREVTPDVIDAAKGYLRDPKRWPDQKEVQMRLQIAGHLDEHAEKALDDLKWRKQSRGPQSAGGAGAVNPTNVRPRPPRSGIGKPRPVPTEQ
jgi:hypothetical protein